MIGYGVKTPDVLNILLARLKPRVNFVDIGANVGWVTSAAGFILSQESKVYSFEPSPTVFKLLKNRVGFLNINNTNIYNIALGSQDSAGELHEFSENFGGASSLKSGAWTGHEESRVSDVTIKHLGSFFRSEGIKQVGLIKIDVQGAELDVLKGARALLEGEHPPMLYVEVEEDALRAFNYSRANLIKLICDFGYEMYCWRNFKLGRIVSVKDLSDSGHDDVICFKGEWHDEIRTFMRRLSA